MVGGGVAGAWAAYRLARRGVRTVLLSSDEDVPPVSRRWAAGLIARELAGEEFAELTELVRYHPFGEFLRPDEPLGPPRLGAGDVVVRAILAKYAELGGVRITGRVTDFVMDGDRCLGVRHQHDGVPGRVRCGDLVLASGGFAGLFADGSANNSGHLLGTHLRHGGHLAGLEMFSRAALGDLDRKRHLYPFDFDGAPQPMRGDVPAPELLAHQGDLAAFRGYWIDHLDEPHTIATTSGVRRLGPVRGFAFGGGAPGRTNVHAVGECSYHLLAESVVGKPFGTFLAQSGALAARLADRATAGTTDFAPGAPQRDALLRKDVEQRLDTFADARFTVERAESFVRWCREQRSRTEILEDVDLLLLAEAYAVSVLARAESRGFFHRPDRPECDPAFDGRHTTAHYDADADEVRVMVMENDR